MSLLVLSGCTQSNSHSQNDMVTVQLSSDYILKTHLSPKNELNEIMADSSNQYLGIFDLNALPTKQDSISSTEKQSIEHKNSVSFDIALNKAVFQPNDYPIYRFDVLTHQDQVRVVVSEDVIDLTGGNTVEKIKMGQYQSALSQELDMPCYSLIDHKHSTDKEVYQNHFCLLKNQDPQKADSIFQVLGPNKSNLLANYNVKELDINVKWKTSIKNRSQLYEIQNHVSDLLNIWNIADTKQ